MYVNKILILCDLCGKIFFSEDERFSKTDKTKEKCLIYAKYNISSIWFKVRYEKNFMVWKEKIRGYFQWINILREN